MKKFFKIIGGIFIGLLILGGIGNYFDKGKNTAPSISKNEDVLKYNIDSLISVLKKDNLDKTKVLSYDEIKDYYFNPIDSSFNIAITNKDGEIKDRLYESLPTFIDTAYHIDKIPTIEGVYLYEFKKGKSFAKGDYKKYLACSSIRFGKLTAAFKEKYCPTGRCTPVYEYLMTNLNDPSSLELEGYFFKGVNKDGTFGTKTIFRAKNSFGALVKQSINCDIDMSGNVSNVQMND